MRTLHVRVATSLLRLRLSSVVPAFAGRQKMQKCASSFAQKFQQQFGDADGSERILCRDGQLNEHYFFADWAKWGEKGVWMWF